MPKVGFGVFLTTGMMAQAFPTRKQGVLVAKGLHMSWSFGATGHVPKRSLWPRVKTHYPSLNTLNINSKEVPKIGFDP